MPKCLSQINSGTIYGRIISKCLGLPVVTVINDQWKPEWRDAVENPVAVEVGLSIGHSIATGLQAARATSGQAVVMSADSYIPKNCELVIPPWIGAVLDPWEYISIWRVSTAGKQAARIRENCTERVEYLTRPGIRPWIQRTGYININTWDDLERARKIELDDTNP